MTTLNTHGTKKRVAMEVTGIPELDAKFAKMQHKMRMSIGKKALRQATKVELEYAKSLVPVDTGKLRKSLSVVSMKTSRAARAKGIVGFKVVPRKSRKEEVQYITVVESGEYEGSRKGTHFLKRASIIAKPKVETMFVTALKRLVAESQE